MRFDGVERTEWRGEEREREGVIMAPHRTQEREEEEGSSPGGAAAAPQSGQRRGGEGDGVGGGEIGREGETRMERGRGGGWDWFDHAYVDRNVFVSAVAAIGVVERNHRGVCALSLHCALAVCIGSVQAVASSERSLCGCVGVWVCGCGLGRVWFSGGEDGRKGHR